MARRSAGVPTQRPPSGEGIHLLRHPCPEGPFNTLNGWYTLAMRRALPEGLTCRTGLGGDGDGEGAQTHALPAPRQAPDARAQSLPPSSGSVTSQGAPGAGPWRPGPDMEGRGPAAIGEVHGTPLVRVPGPPSGWGPRRLPPWPLSADSRGSRSWTSTEGLRQEHFLEPSFLWTLLLKTEPGTRGVSSQRTHGHHRSGAAGARAQVPC